MILQSGNRSILYFNYLANKDFITANFCENINKPKLSCEGKCHLKKQLDKETEREEKLPFELKEKFDYISDQLSLITIYIPISSYFKTEHNTQNSIASYTSPSIEFLLPPKI